MMRASSRPGDDPSSGARPAWRRWVVLLGLLMLFVVVFDLLGRIGRREEPSDEAAGTRPPAQAEPIFPVVARAGRTGMRITLVEGDYRLARNLHDEALADQVVACVEQGVDTSPALAEGGAAQTPPPGGMFARGVREHRVWRETLRIYNRCLTEAGHDPLDEPPRNE